MTATGSADRFAEAHRQLLADRSIQFEMKGFEPPKVPSWLRSLSEFLQDAGPVMKIVFWSIVAIAVALLLWGIARWLDGRDFFRRKPRDETESDENWRPEEAPARALLREADALAASGRYSEAAHLLLHRSIEDIDSRRPALVRPALTSRDIAGAPALPPGPRAAFSRIVALVERSLFGRSPLGEPDWRDCRAAYEAFAFAPEWWG